MRAAWLPVAVGAAGFALGAWALAETLLAARPAPPPPVTIDAALAEAGRAPVAEPRAAWPAVFDAYVPDPPVAAAPAAPPPRYRLVGLVAGGAEGWAILAGSGGDLIVRRGDMLPGDQEVLAIEEAGVRLRRGADEIVIRFDTTPKSLLAGLIGDDAPLEAEVPLSLLAGRDMRRVLGRAGSVRMVAPAGGAQGELVPEILWVREGQIYDLIGLRQGDRVMRVNGVSVSGAGTLARAEEMLSQAREVAVEILRGGRRRVITVRITGRS